MAAQCRRSDRRLTGIALWISCVKIKLMVFVRCRVPSSHNLHKINDAARSIHLIIATVYTRKSISQCDRTPSICVCLPLDWIWHVTVAISISFNQIQFKFHWLVSIRMMLVDSIYNVSRLKSKPSFKFSLCSSLIFKTSRGP